MKPKLKFSKVNILRVFLKEVKLLIPRLDVQLIPCIYN